LVDQEDPIYDSIKELPHGQDSLNIYVPKVLCFFSQNPFFVSFRYILDEIYTQSVVNDAKCFKVENMLSTLLYRMYLPKYETTQIQFALGDKMYRFSRDKCFNTEISLKLLFSYLTVERVVFLMIAFLMNSIIVFFHSE
jgi:hypothetical protein